MVQEVFVLRSDGSCVKGSLRGNGKRERLPEILKHNYACSSSPSHTLKHKFKAIAINSQIFTYLFTLSIVFSSNYNEINR